MIIPKLFYENEYKDFLPVFESVSAASISVPKGCIQSELTDLSTSVFYIYEGIVEWSITDENGNKNTLLFVGPGNIYPMPYSGKKLIMTEFLSFRAITPLKLLQIPRERFNILLTDNPSLSDKLLHCYSNICDSLLSKIYLDNHSTSVGQISTLILTFFDSSKDEKKSLSLSQEEIAEITGVTRVQVTRVLKLLRDEHIISTNRRSIEILDYDRLKYICENYE